MRCLTPSEIRKWLAGQGMHHQPLDHGVPFAGDFPLPAAPRARIQLADFLATLLAKDGNQLLEVMPAPQARNDEAESLDEFRRNLDEPLGLIAAPGHLFKKRDRLDFHRLLATLLGFPGGWSFYIYSAPSRTTVLIGDRVWVWSPKKGLRNELGRHLTATMAA
jgi:hypothetical protein